MKTIIKCIVLCLLLGTQMKATIHTVSNNWGLSVDHHFLQEAIDEANAGDTLHVYGSPAPYEPAVLNKRLVLLGPGYFLNQNGAEYSQENENPAQVIIQVTASNSVLKGLTINFEEVHDIDFDWVSDVYVLNCHLIGELKVHVVERLYIRGCYWEKARLYLDNAGTGTDDVANNVQLTDNLILTDILPPPLNGFVLCNWYVAGVTIDIFPRSLAGKQLFGMSGNIMVNESEHTLLIPPNFVRVDNSSGGLESGLDYTTGYHRNIFVSPAGFNYVPANIWLGEDLVNQHGPLEIAYLTTNPYDDYNIVPVAGVFGTEEQMEDVHNVVVSDPSTLFVGFPENMEGYSNEGRFQYIPNSVADNFPHGGYVGPFREDLSGNYRLSGHRIMPNIYEISPRVVAPSNDGEITIRIKARAN